jgi:hypothetical protein
METPEGILAVLSTEVFEFKFGLILVKISISPKIVFLIVVGILCSPFKAIQNIVITRKKI